MEESQHYPHTLDFYYEPTTSKPLIQDAIVEDSKQRRYRVDRWFSGKGHCYVFVDIAIRGHKHPFAQKPSQVEKALKNNLIKIIKNGTEQHFT